jgi:glycosyltransferase involved in cell wall biosynthesis
MTSQTIRPSTVAAVIVNYNYESFLADAIESVLDQSRPFAEIIVVDDGSTDGSAAVAARYEPEVRLVRKSNGGQLSACFAGLDACTADYVYFLDADDLATPELVACVEVVTASRPVKVQFPLRAVDGERIPTGSVFPSFPSGYDRRRMIHDNRVLGFYTCPPTSGNVYRRDTLLGLDRSVLDERDFIDGPATLVLPHFGEIVSINRPVALYRIHGANHSQWFAPSAELLRGEIDWFLRRWEQAGALLGLATPPFAGKEPAYVAERRLMIAALDGRSWAGTRAAAFVGSLWRSHVTPSHKLAFTAWALLLVIPSLRLRRRLVVSRRSPSDRPALVRWLMRLRRAAPSLPLRRSRS